MLMIVCLCGGLLACGIVILYHRQAQREAAMLRIMAKRMGSTLPKNHVYDLGDVSTRFGPGVGD